MLLDGAFVGCYQIGFGPITWLILSEIFPLEIRSTAVSAGALANFGSGRGGAVDPALAVPLLPWLGGQVSEWHGCSAERQAYPMGPSAPPLPGGNVLVALLFDFERLRFGEAILFGQFMEGPVSDFCCDAHTTPQENTVPFFHP